MKRNYLKKNKPYRNGLKNFKQQGVMNKSVSIMQKSNQIKAKHDPLALVIRLLISLVREVYLV